MKETVLALHELFDILPDAAVIVDAKGHIVFANASVQRVLGYDPNELAGQPLSILIPQRFRSLHESQVAQFREIGHSTAMGDRPILQAVRKDEVEISVSISIANIDLNDERFSVALVRDATPVREELDQAIVHAETDALTSIGNRLYLSRHIQTALANNSALGLLFLDLKQFKPFNDRYGHKVGDAVLCLVAKRIKMHIRSADLAARVGGDEFAIVLGGLADKEQLHERARIIIESLCEPFTVLGVHGSIDVNIGGAMSPQDGINEQELLEVADQNMYRAKRAGQRYLTN